MLEIEEENGRGELRIDDAGSTMSAYRLLPWDTEFFGFNVARILPGRATNTELERVLDELRRHDVRLAYWFAKLDNSQLDAEFLARLGGQVVDERVTFRVDLAGAFQPVAEPGNFEVVPYDGSMRLDEMQTLAIQSGAYSRFAVDPRLPSGKFEEMYRLWMDRALNGELADEVLVAKCEGRSVGMVTLRVREGCGEIGLIAVDAEARGRGCGRQLVRRAQDWFIAHGCREAVVVTQSANEAACGLYARCGYTVAEKERIVHFWLR